MLSFVNLLSTYQLNITVLNTGGEKEFFENNRHETRELFVVNVSREIDKKDFIARYDGVSNVYLVIVTCDFLGRL